MGKVYPEMFSDLTSRGEGLTAEDADDGPCALVHEPGLLEALAVLGGRGSGGHLLAVRTTQQRNGNVRVSQHGHIDTHHTQHSTSLFVVTAF